MEEGGGFLKGTAMNAIDGRTIMSGSATHDGMTYFMLECVLHCETFYCEAGMLI